MEKNVMEKLLAYYEENPDDFNEDLEEVEAYNGYLNGSRIIPMDELDEYFYSPLEALNKAYYGYDEDSDNNSENGKREPFCLNRNYFHFDECGTLFSTDYKDYSDWLDKETIATIIGLYKDGHVFLTQGAQEIINAEN